MKEQLLNFTNYSVEYGPEFPNCCVSGYYMSYNTHLRDPMKNLGDPRQEEAPEELIRKELTQSKKNRSK